MGLHNLPEPKGANRPSKRKGRGVGSGLGKTAGRGQKGQRSRASGNVRPGFEGGQMPLIRRVPKRGFTNPFRVANQVVNLRDLEQLSANEITPELLVSCGLAARADGSIKILGTGEVTRAYVVKGCKASRAAREKVERAGGRIEG
ncbi:MAG: 50S ribosomal protein L15 [Gemmatimonadales bacterium]